MKKSKGPKSNKSRSKKKIRKPVLALKEPVFKKIYKALNEIKSIPWTIYHVKYCKCIYFTCYFALIINMIFATKETYHISLWFLFTLAIMSTCLKYKLSKCIFCKKYLPPMQNWMNKRCKHCKKKIRTT